MKKLPFIIILLIILGCASGERLTSVKGMPAEAPIATIHLKGENCTWSPDVIKVSDGTHVILEVESVDWDYNFMLKGYDLRFVIPEGETKKAEFYASEEGEFEFGCYIEEGHHYLWGGMVGKLIVE